MWGVWLVSVRSAERGVGEPPVALQGVAGGHGDLDAADGDADQRADLEELEADRAAGGMGELCRLEAEAAHSFEEHISHRGEPQAKLVGRHGGGRRAVGEEIELAFLDAVLHLAAGAIAVLVEHAGVGALLAERGHDEARIGLALGVLGLADDPPAAAPAIERRPQEVLEAPRRDAGEGALDRRLGKFGRDLLDQAGVARQAEQVVDAAFLTPRRRGLAGKAREALMGWCEEGRVDYLFGLARNVRLVEE